MINKDDIFRSYKHASWNMILLFVKKWKMTFPPKNILKYDIPVLWSKLIFILSSYKMVLL